MTAFELAVQDLAGIAIAERVGADRVEVCSALAGGGVTPSLAFVRAAAAGSVAAHVLVRPREGDFEYSADERALAVDDVVLALEAGAAGVVIGATRDGAVDEAFMAAVIDAAHGAPVTFHRAFDIVADRGAALDTLIGLGATRILTSGGAAVASEAVGELSRLVELASGRIEIMAGGGVTAATAARVAASGVDAVHASAKHTLSGVGVALGSRGDSVRESTDAEHAGRIASALGRGAAS